MTTVPSGPSHTPFDEIFCGFLPRLYRRAVMLTGSKHAGEDAVHEAYLKLAVRPQRFLAHPEPYAYAFTALLSVVRDAHRRDRRQLLTDDVEQATAGWDGGIGWRDSELEAVRLLRRLSARQAGVVVLVDLDGYTIDQAAQIMQVHRGTAARHRARALDKLRDVLGETRPGEPGPQGGAQRAANPGRDRGGPGYGPRDGSPRDGSGRTGEGGAL
ncbi:RNA polymerase sigma factor [Streptomyces sp. H27-D2]|uniref:RNA polymerase sigma factor n=1 Tax=Streptomyces sp. H27-D2 TaxID=3046304 RepID=UPI002DC0456C|nr:sigma-70 family RNA polymerase sigma factor [Streptomyces sp. H27-D2]MEC4016789.1 sigma-70 family RNA polymerase sigma factor [Streptomyces sp. H27-D2]